MCTVTYLPLGNNLWLLTANRDESPLRPAEPPAVHTNNGIRMLYPRDTLGGGSWMAVTGNGKSGCILNGAFEPHKRKPPYRKSRGLVLLDFLAEKDGKNFLRSYDLEGIEPFTMVGVDNGAVYEFRWDGSQRYLSFPDPAQPQIWASATLYSAEWIEKRRKWFNDWLSHKPLFTREAILNFHLHTGEGDLMNDLVMNRYDMVRTLSITSIEKNATSISMLYHDLLNGQESVTAF